MNDEPQLIDGYLDGELTADEERRLAEWLAADREHVRQFVRETYLHRKIRETMLARQFRADAVATVDRAAREPWPWPARVLPQLVALPWTTVLRRVWLPLTACVALVAGFCVWCFGPTMGEPVLAEVSAGGVMLERAGKTVAATGGMRLQFADVLRTGTNSVTITYAPEKTRVELQANTELTLSDWSKGKRFDLRRGKLAASIARQRPLRPLLIRTPHAEARVLGTRFTLAVTTNATRLEVADGKVRLKRLSDGEVRVGAGNYAVAAPGYELAQQPLTGSILREYWTNLPGTRWFDLITYTNYPDRPDGWSYLTNLSTLEMPLNWADNYGARLRGYVHPAKTGDYTFWITAKDHASLWLSPDEDPENKVQMANSEGAAPRDWQSDAAQQTTAVPLTAGKRYYFEVLHKAGVGDDHLAVAWQPPGGTPEVIPGEYLSPFKLKPK
ncbi:MAG: hypothetical protein DME23_22935 [Verrucomicrobia bacterium]|nr:MAG: hypothetical protein DME23_22935 [Verrucomicrobiota bacterium]